MEKYNNLENEIWKDVEGYEGFYQVSNKGRVKSLDRISINKNGLKCHFKERILNPRLNSGGYREVPLCKNGTQHSARVHRLVAKAFIPNPDNLPFINHKDENKENNCVENLEWCTPEYNVNYSQAIPISEFDLDGNWIKNWPSIVVAEREIPISSADLCSCCKGLRYTAKGRIWRYWKPEYKEGYILTDIQEKPILGRPISQFDMDGNYIKTWPNSVLAAKELKISAGNIRACCNGIDYSYKGFIFRNYRPEYKEGYNLFDIDINHMLYTPVMKVDIKTGENLQLYDNCLQAYKEMDKRGGVVNGWQRIYQCCMGLIPLAFNYKWKFYNEISLNK